MHNKHVLEAQIEKDRERLISVVVESIQIPSVKEPSVHGSPFGKSVNAAFQHVLGAGSDLGFEVGSIDGYVGWIEHGKGKDLVGALAHVDVVPEGNLSAWRFPPYEGRIHNGFLFGRGAADDKGPLFCVLFGLKALRDVGLPISKRVRLIIGTDEESGWGGIRHYLQHEEIPSCAFAADGMFTAINREKGITVVTLAMPLNHRVKNGLRIASIQGGEAVNSVPDSAQATLLGDTAQQSIVQQALGRFHRAYPEATIKMKSGNNSCWTLASRGQSAHAMAPEKGRNAIAFLLRFLTQLPIELDDPMHFVQLIDRKIGLDHTGASLNMAWRDKPSGPLTLNLGPLTLDERNAQVSLDIRSPISIPCEQVESHLRTQFQRTPIMVDIRTRKEPLYVPEECPLIRTLSRAYQVVSGREPVLHAVGGGTYARALDNCVSFGAVHPGEEITVHQPNERVSIENLLLNAKIYAYALYELLK